MQVKIYYKNIYFYSVVNIIGYIVNVWDLYQPVLIALLLIVPFFIAQCVWH